MIETLAFRAVASQSGRVAAITADLSGGLRPIWLRNELETMKKRLKTRKTCWAQERLVLPQAQIMALKTATSKRQATGEIEIHQPGYLGSQDTCLVGTTKGARRTYQQTFVETCCRLGLAKLYVEKTTITNADMLNDQIVPFFRAQNVPLLHIFIGRGTNPALKRGCMGACFTWTPAICALWSCASAKRSRR